MANDTLTCKISYWYSLHIGTKKIFLQKKINQHQTKRVNLLCLVQNKSGNTRCARERSQVRKQLLGVDCRQQILTA